MIDVEKQNGMFDLSRVYGFLNNLPDGVWSIVVKPSKSKKRKPRSIEQNAWLWGCIYPLLMKGLVDAGWEVVNTDQVHELMKQHFTSERIVNRHTGEIIQLPESTSQMNTSTFSAYCEKLREYASEYLGIEIPDPDPNWKTNQ